MLFGNWDDGIVIVPVTGSIVTGFEPNPGGGNSIVNTPPGGSVPPENITGYVSSFIWSIGQFGRL